MMPDKILLAERHVVMILMVSIVNERYFNPDGQLDNELVSGIGSLVIYKA